MAFYAKREQDRYWDADFSRQINFESPWSINIVDADDLANNMHDMVVEEITDKMVMGIYGKCPCCGR